MKKSLLVTLLITAALSLSAQYANTRLWRISGNGLTQPSYLFGSMHVDDARVFNFSDSLFYALASCEVFTNEVAFDSVLPFLYKNMDQKFDQKMEEMYFNDDEALDELSQSTGLDKGTLKKISPVVLKQLLPGNSGAKNRKPAVLDSYLYNIAKREGKICTGIEELNMQIDLFDQYPEYLKKDYTEYTIGKKRSSKNSAMVDIYHKADLNAIESMMKSLPPDVYKAMITDRNFGMARSIDSISQRKSAFYTVGFAHLPGSEGLIDLLKNKGYNVDPVIETFTGMADKFPFSKREIPWVTYSDPKAGFSIDMPGKWYTSPNFPQGIMHGMYFELGTNSFYMTAARSSSAFGSISDGDSLIKSFILNAWKIQVPQDKIHKVILEGIEFRQVDKLKLNGFYLSARIAIEGDVMYIIVGLNNQEKEMGDINRFFNSFRKIDKIAENWNTFTSVKGSYEIKFPGNPLERIIEDNSGEQSGTLVGMINGNDNTTGNEYLVQFIDNDKVYYSDDTLALGRIQNGMAATIKYKELISENTKFEGYPALKSAFKLETGQTYRVLTVIRGTRIYTLISAESSSAKDTLQPGMFFKSFRFKNADLSNWTIQKSDEGHFSTLSPSEFKQVIEQPEQKYFTGSESYYSFDEFSGDKLFVTRKVFSPYYQGDCDSTFFRNLLGEVLSEEDSVVSQEKISNDPPTYVYSYISPKNHIITNAKYILKGRSLFSLLVMYPRLSENIHPAIQSITSFEVSDTLTPGNIVTNKTPKLLADLSSGDTTQSYPAKEALQFYEFKKEEMPLVWQTLLQPFNDDTLKYNSSRVLLINSIGPLLDSVYNEKLIASFDSVCPTYPAKIEALSWLTAGFDVRYRDFVKEQLMLIPENVYYKYKVTSLLYDSAEYCRGMYPEIMGMLTDSLNRDDMINITSGLLKNDQLSISDLNSCKAEIFEFIKTVISGQTKLYEDDFLTPKIFLIAGYFNDPEINEFLENNKSSEYKYVAYNIFKTLINNNLKFKQKDVARLAEDPDLRRGLHDFLKGKGKVMLLPEKYRSQQAIAESDFYEYMTSEDYLPESLTLMGVKDIIYNDTLQRFYLISFESVYEDEKEFVASIAGPYPTDNSVPEFKESVLGVYWSDDTDKTAEEHFDEFELLLKEDQSENQE